MITQKLRPWSPKCLKRLMTLIIHKNFATFTYSSNSYWLAIYSWALLVVAKIFVSPCMRLTQVRFLKCKILPSQVKASKKLVQQTIAWTSSDNQLSSNSLSQLKFRRSTEARLSITWLCFSTMVRPTFVATTWTFLCRVSSLTRALVQTRLLLQQQKLYWHRNSNL